MMEATTVELDPLTEVIFEGYSSGPLSTMDPNVDYILPNTTGYPLESEHCEQEHYTDLAGVFEKGMTFKYDMCKMEVMPPEESVPEDSDYFFNESDWTTPPDSEDADEPVSFEFKVLSEQDMLESDEDAEAVLESIDEHFLLKFPPESGNLEKPTDDQPSAEYIKKADFLDDPNDPDYDPDSDGNTPRIRKEPRKPPQEKPCMRESTLKRLGFILSEVDDDDTVWYTCVQCGFKTSAYLTVHNHSKKHRCDTYNCNICNKRFVDKHTLRFHVEGVHDRLVMFPCKLCGKRYPRKGALTNHIRTIHTKESNVTCQICGRVLRRVGFLKRHIASHTRAQPFTCTECGKRFADKSTAVKHLVGIHGAQPEDAVILVDKSGPDIELKFVDENN